MAKNEKSEIVPKRFPITDLIWIIIGGRKVQLLFLLMFILIFPFLAAFLKEFNKIVESRKQGNPDYNWPSYEDLWLMTKALAVLILVQNFMRFTLLSSATKLVSQRYSEQERQDRAKRQIDCIFKTGYFVFSVCFAYYVAKDSYFLPKSLGGKGYVKQMFRDFPYQGTEEFPLIREYLMVQLAYHTNSFIVHILSKPRNDFIEMLLHHSMTVFLIGLAYYMNYVTMSLLVLFTHDISDMFVYLTRVFVDTDFKKATLASYTLLMVSWAYTRLIVFPVELIATATYFNPVYEEIHGMWLLGGMLHFLLVLHFYWFYLLIKMGMRFATKGKVQDIQHKITSSNKN